MNINELTEHTNKMLSKLTGSSINLDPNIMEQIRAMNENIFETNRMRKVQHHSLSGPDFQIPHTTASYPFISNLKDDGSIELETIEPATFKMKYNSALSDKMTPTRVAGYRDIIPQINKAAFSRGIDLGNFQLLNVSDRSMNESHIKQILTKGKIVPLGTNHGVFVPNFALKDSTLLSLEYEGIFKSPSMGGDYSEAFKKYVRDPVKTSFGFDPMNLLSHDAGAGFSPRAYSDTSYNAPAGMHVKEIVMGAAPIANLIFATHAAFAAWDKTGMIPREHRALPYNAGMHVSTTVPALSDSSRYNSISNYLKHAGVVLSSLSRTKTRWRASNYLGIPKETFSDDRLDFRVQTNSHRLECRYPGSVFDIGHVTNQLIVASKIASDAQRYSETHDNQSNVNIINSRTSYQVSLSGQTEAQNTLFRPLHASARTSVTDEERAVAKDWFNSFMDTLGITDQFEKDFMLNMNAQCSKT